MVTTTRRQPYPKAYTIIESLVVLAILTILTIVVLALYNHEKHPAQPTGKTSTATRSVPSTDVPADPLPSANNEEKTD